MAATIILGLLVAAGTTRAAAEPPVEALLQALAPIERLQGRFEQRQYTDADELVMESSGRFALLRPGFFLWEITAPDNQLVIADPVHVWHYDRDLDTVTRRDAGAGSAATPLQILGGDAQALRDGYEVTADAVAGGYRLVPTAGEADFDALTIRFNDGVLVEMTILDRLQQRIEINFVEVDSSAALSPDDFNFEPPATADLFIHDQ